MNEIAKIDTKKLSIVKCGEKRYFSAYKDEVVNRQTAAVAMKSLFAAFKISDDAMSVYISAVINAGMTRQRLNDAIMHAVTNSEFAPKPAELIKFDKADDTRRLYSSAEMYDICQKLMAKYYDMECSENVYNSTKIYEACRQAYFEKVGDYWCLSEVGMKRRSEVEEIERMSKYDVKCVNVGRVYLG